MHSHGEFEKDCDCDGIFLMALTITIGGLYFQKIISSQHDYIHVLEAAMRCNEKRNKEVSRRMEEKFGEEMGTQNEILRGDDGKNSTKT